MVYVFLSHRGRRGRHRDHRGFLRVFEGIIGFFVFEIYGDWYRSKVSDF